MSSRCRYAARITVKSIAAAMKNRGGRTVEQIRLQRLARSGLKPTHCRDGKLLLGTMRPRPTRRQMTDVWSGLLFSFLPHDLLQALDASAPC